MLINWTMELIQLKRVKQTRNVNISMCRCKLMLKNILFTKKSIDGLIEATVNQSITGLALDQGDKSFFQEQEPKVVDKTKLWMDLDDFFICFKYFITII